MERPAGVVEFTPDAALFPFVSRWFDSSVGPVHYLDEGPGIDEGPGTDEGPEVGGSSRPTLLLLHGNPDWSFLYRKIIVGLRGEFRCVAPDYPGFGLSCHPHGYGYTPAEHATVVGELVDHLRLDAMVVMGQDWGGPIGMDVASRRADRVRGLVMGNTWFWPDNSRMIRLFSKTMGSRPMQHLITHRNFFVSPLMRRSLNVEISEREFAHYADVVPNPASRKGIARFPIEILRSHPWLGELEARVAATLAGTPTVLMFGRKDPALASEAFIDRWLQQFPDATYIDLPEAGHYIQEDAPEEIIAAIRAGFG